MTIGSIVDAFNFAFDFLAGPEPGDGDDDDGDDDDGDDDDGDDDDGDDDVIETDGEEV